MMLTKRLKLKKQQYNSIGFIGLGLYGFHPPSKLNTNKLRTMSKLLGTVLVLYFDKNRFILTQSVVKI